VGTLGDAGVAVAPLAPANCGFECAWSPFFVEHFAGAPVKAVAAQVVGEPGAARPRRGEVVVAAAGVEGSLIHAWPGRSRRQLAANRHGDPRARSAGRTPARRAGARARPSRRRANDRLPSSFGAVRALPG
jgi:predicted flavoprotein YhiN